MRICVRQAGETECLRRLDADETGAIDRLAQDGFGAGQRIGNGEGRYGPFAMVQRLQQPVDYAGRAEWPGSVVDQNDVGLDDPKTGADAVGTLRATDDQLPDTASGQGLESQLFLSITDHHPHGIDRRMRRQSIDRMGEHRLAGQGTKLLGNLAAHPAPRSGGDDEGYDRHGLRLARIHAFL